MSASKRFGIFVIAGVLVVCGAELGERLSIPGVHSLIPNAEARFGRPLTPVSVAGVSRRTARRTTRRVIAATSIYVAALPPNCTTVIIEGTTLQQCGSTYYQASGSQYVVVNVN